MFGPRFVEKELPKRIAQEILSDRNGYARQIIRLFSFHPFLQKLDEISLAETAEKTQGREDAIRFGKNISACSNHAPPCASKCKGRQVWQKAIAGKKLQMFHFLFNCTCLIFILLKARLEIQAGNEN